MASVRKRTWKRSDGTEGKSYEVVWRDPGTGEQRTKGGFQRKRDADLFASEVEVEKARGTMVDPRRGQVTFGEWCENEWWDAYAASVGERTRNRYEGILRNHLLPEFGDVALSDIRQEQIQRWVGAQTGEYAPGTIRKHVDLLQRALRKAVSQRRIPETPCRDIDLPSADTRADRRAQALTPGEIDRLVAKMDERYRAMVLVAAYGGLRLGEVAGLKAGAIDEVNRQVRVVETIEWVRGKPRPKPVPKSAAGRRSVALAPKVFRALTEHRREYGTSDEGYVFTSPDGERLRKDNFYRRVWKPAAEAAGLDGVRFHDLRHTAASLMIRAGADPLTLSRRLGHAKPSYTLDLYGHFYPDQDAALAQRMDEYVGGGQEDDVQRLSG